MSYIEPKCVEGAFSEDLLLDIKRKYCTWFQHGWKSHNRNTFEYGHGQHNIVKQPKHFQWDMLLSPDIETNHPIMLDTFDVLQDVIGKRALYRTYTKTYHYGQDAYPHTDKQARDGDVVQSHPGFETAILYMTKDWDPKYYGMTLLYDDSQDVEVAMLPKYNRLFIFDSAQLHSTSPLSRIAPFEKTIMVFNTAPKGYGDEGVKYLYENTTKVQHTGRPFFHHLWNVYMYLEQLGAEKPVCMAGLWHSVYGDVYKKHDVNMFTPKIVEKHIGKEAERLIKAYGDMAGGISPRFVNVINSGDKRLMMIELANLVDQNFNGQYNERCQKLVVAIDELK